MTRVPLLLDLLLAPALLAVGALALGDPKAAVTPQAATARPGAAKAAESATAARDANYNRFDKDVRPLLAKYCVNCHSTAKPMADLALDVFADVKSIDRDPDVWHKVDDMLSTGAMPPEDEAQPTAAEMAKLKAWVSGQLVNCSLERDPGRVTIRRLNRAEYNNTIRDLVGVDFKPADDFPSDDVGEGFDNIGDVLSMPPILMEKYLSAAEKILDRALVVVPPTPPVTSYEGKRLQGGGSQQGGARQFPSNGEAYVHHKFVKDGEYILRVKAWGTPAGDEPPRVLVRVNKDEPKSFDVGYDESKPDVHDYKVTVKQGSQKVSVAFANDFYDAEHPDPGKRDRNLSIASVDVVGPLDVDGRVFPESHRKIIFVEPEGEKPSEASKLDCAKKILRRFGNRAFRRPITDAELIRLVMLYEMANKEGERFERSIQVALQGVLVSPHFLFRIELDAEGPPGAATGTTPSGIRRLNPFELATRLSYFLWSSMPDDALFAAASSGTLHRPEVLEEQVRRMMKDPRSKALAENFAGQWLQIRNLQTISPDRRRFPTFDDDLRASMQKETEMFFEEIVREDRSVFDFIDGDYTFINERLAKHYGIEGVRGAEFRKVNLPAEQRGGVITQASILTITSNPTRTSPVKRGKWVMETLLGSSPPPPPPGAGELVEETPRKPATGTLRQRMAQHLSNPACASCHKMMDPIGLGFENFDAIGAWRTKDGKFDIDVSGSLPGGKTFSGPKELRALLKANKEAFCRCLSEKMLTYALGRGLSHADRCAINDLTAALAKNDYRFSALVLGIAASEPFQKRNTNRGGK